MIGGFVRPWSPSSPEGPLNGDYGLSTGGFTLSILLELHPAALENMNQQADAFSSMVTSIKARPRPKLTLKLQSGESVELEGAKMGPLAVSSADQEHLVITTDLGSQIEISGPVLQKVRLFSSKLAEGKVFRGIISARFLEECLYEWMGIEVDTERQSGAEAGEREKRTFTNHLKEVVEAKVIRREFWLPVDGFKISSDLVVRGVRFVNVTRDLLETWFPIEKWDSEEVRQSALGHQCERLEGKLVGVISVESGPHLGIEKARDHLEEALDYLRFFLPDFLSPKMTSIIAPTGESRILRGEFTTRLPDGGLQMSHNIWTRFNVHELTGKRRELTEQGLCLVEDVFAETQLSEFEEALVGSLRLFSRGGLEENLETRLLYILSSVESFLLGGSTSASIMQTVGERLSFFVFRSADERREAFAYLREVYDIRSGFFHHGKKISADSHPKAERLMRDVWKFFHRALRMHAQWSTRKEFFAAIESEKFMGASDFLNIMREKQREQQREQEIEWQLNRYPNPSGKKARSEGENSR